MNMLKLILRIKEDGRYILRDKSAWMMESESWNKSLFYAFPDNDYYFQMMMLILFHFLFLQ